MRDLYCPPGWVDFLGNKKLCAGISTFGKGGGLQTDCFQKSGHCLEIHWRLDWRRWPGGAREAFIKQAQDKCKSGDRERAAKSWKRQRTLMHDRHRGLFGPGWRQRVPFMPGRGAADRTWRSLPGTCPAQDPVNSNSDEMRCGELEFDEANTQVFSRKAWQMSSTNVVEECEGIWQMPPGPYGRWK